MEAYKHISNWKHVLLQHGKLILIEQMNNIKNASTEDLRQRPKDRERAIR